MNILGTIITAITFIFLCSFIGAAILQWLWNMTCPELFNLKTVTYWQAFRLIWIGTFLFKGAGSVSSNNK